LVGANIGKHNLKGFKDWRIHELANWRILKVHGSLGIRFSSIVSPMNPPIRQSANSSIVDQLGKEIPLPSSPLKIVSLVPSQTELLHSLGLQEEVVGITKFCVHPAGWHLTKPRVGGTKKLDIGKIRSLQPNLVIANKEENTPEDVQEIEAFCPVWTSDITSFNDAIDMISSIGQFTGTAEKAAALVSEIIREFNALKYSREYRSAYLIWKNPWMAAGGGTFINDMLRAFGMKNILEEKVRYPVIDINTLEQLGVEVLLLSSEPYPFKMKELIELTEILPQIKIVMVDGEMFSWYGSRMLYSPGYFRSLREKLDG
jgi:ABC-type Fe3+-hydroxamate transport system substrate-binding protein